MRIYAKKVNDNMEIDRSFHLNRLIARKGNGMIKVVTGIRRCGKSYLLFEAFCKHLLEQGVSEDHIIKVDLEDRRNKALRNPDNLLAFIDGKMIDSKMYYILLDEVQLVSEFEDVLNSYLSVKNADVYVTGSNSRFLSKDVITEFRGRGDEIKIAPLSFREFFSAFDGSKEDALDEYLIYGGLPKVALTADKTQKAEYLSNLFATTYLTDIKERYKIKNDAELEELINVLSSSIGGLTNPTKLENTFHKVMKSSISKNTIKSYLDILEEVFLVEKSIRYDIKGRKYIDTPAKYYFCDCGLRNVRISFRQNETTHLVENLIYNELRNRGVMVDVGMIMLYGKDDQQKSQRMQLEVDFVCNKGSKRCYIQSALSLPTTEKKEQEIRSLRSIDDSFAKYVITADHIKRYTDEYGITYLNLFEFLLSEDII